MRVDNIQSGSFEGYYWMSDETTPHTLMNQEFTEVLNTEKNPFIIEAQLYDKSQKVSYSVKFVDGNYLIYRWENITPALKGEEYVPMSFYANRVGDDINRTDLNLCFLQHWVAEEDEACQNMKVLQAKETIFVGFNAF